MGLTIIMFFPNLNVHFLCTDVMITPLLLCLLRSFVKVKISCVQYCTLYTFVSLQKVKSLQSFILFLKEVKNWNFKIRQNLAKETVLEWNVLIFRQFTFQEKHLKWDRHSSWILRSVQWYNSLQASNCHYTLRNKPEECRTHPEITYLIVNRYWLDFINHCRLVDCCTGYDGLFLHNNALLILNKR
jgi:hypothetical protein